MKFSENFAEILGSRPKLQILKHIMTPGFEINGRELSRMTGLSHMTVNRIMKYFYANNLVKLKRYGRTYSWTANGESYLYEKLKKVIAGIKELDPMNDLNSYVTKKVQSPGVIKAFIYGSIAKGKEQSDSDIDVFVIVKDGNAKQLLAEKLEKASLESMRIFGNMISPYILTAGEYESKKNRLAVVAEAEKGIRIV
jgi:predicted nucleotidyltransferase